MFCSSTLSVPKIQPITTHIMAHSWNKCMRSIFFSVVRFCFRENPNKLSFLRPSRFFLCVLCAFLKTSIVIIFHHAFAIKGPGSGSCSSRDRKSGKSRTGCEYHERFGCGATGCSSSNLRRIVFVSLWHHRSSKTEAINPEPCGGGDCDSHCFYGARYYSRAATRHAWISL